MRYIPIPEVTFVDSDGVSYLIKDIRPLETDLTLAFIIQTKGETQLDAIATRNDVFGENGIGRIHEIFDFNAIEIKESGFDLSKIRSLKIPV